MIDLTPLAQAVITLAAALITVYVVPYVKSKTNAQQLERMQSWTRIGVKAAEQMFSGSERGKEKRKYVMDFLHSKGFKVDLKTVDALIEAEVNQLWPINLMTIEEDDNNG